MAQSVALITLGCSRNEVDSEEVAGQLAAQGWTIVSDPAEADAVLVNTCGFVDVAKKDSIDTLLAASEARPAGQRVIAIGCLADRYGGALGASMPELDAVLSFDDYPTIHESLEQVIAGSPITAHVPRDRRLPIAPIDREPAGWQPVLLRHRLAGGPVAPVKLATGCDRRCSFCAIPRFRGSFRSRPPADIAAEVALLAADGVREVVLVSENSTSYGKDLGDIRALEQLLPQLDSQGLVARIRVAYLQPAEIRPGLLEIMAKTPSVANGFDISFQHASPNVLRRMRRFGSGEAFLDLIDQIRALAPDAGIRSNVIVGFPGETEDDLAQLVEFLEAAGLDAIGVFGYSNEDDTEAASFPDQLSDSLIAERVAQVSTLAQQLMEQRAIDRIGSSGVVLVESTEIDDELGQVAIGRCAHQNPDDSATIVLCPDALPAIGSFIEVEITDVRGLDLIATR
jgi:ribosomal protein S12 methylthiotransferase